MVLRALKLSFAQLGDRRIIIVFAKSMLISLLLCGFLGWTLGYAASHFFDRWFGGGERDTYYYVVSTIGTLLALVFGFRVVSVPVTGFFGDEVVEAIEGKYFPTLVGQAKPVTLGMSLSLAAASFARVLLLNLIALPFYIFLFFTAIGPFILFLALNAMLLGRDLAEMVAVRHLDKAQMRQWLRNHRFDCALLGLIVTGLFLIPFVNLIAPILGAAAATHLFHGRS